MTCVNDDCGCPLWIAAARRLLGLRPNVPTRQRMWTDTVTSLSETYVLLRDGEAAVREGHLAVELVPDEATAHGRTGWRCWWPAPS